MIVTLWLIRETEAARLFSRTPPDSHRNPDPVWIPRSVIPHLLKLASPNGQWRECQVTVEDWWAEKHNL